MPVQPDTYLGQLKEAAMRKSLTESYVPEGKAKSIAVHDGGCYALTFNRWEHFAKIVLSCWGWPELALMQLLCLQDNYAAIWHAPWQSYMVPLEIPLKSIKAYEVWKVAELLSSDGGHSQRGAKTLMHTALIGRDLC